MVLPYIKGYYYTKSREEMYARSEKSYQTDMYRCCNPTVDLKKLEGLDLNTLVDSNEVCTKAAITSNTDKQIQDLNTCMVKRLRTRGLAIDIEQPTVCHAKIWISSIVLVIIMLMAN